MFERDESARLQRVSAVLQSKCGAERMIEIFARTWLRPARSGLRPATWTFGMRFAAFSGKISGIRIPRSSLVWTWSFRNSSWFDN